MTKVFSILHGSALSAVLVLTAAVAHATEQPDTAEAIVDGKRLFATSCGFCHSKGGRKAGKGPKLANSPRSDAFLIERIKNGKKGRMPAFSGAFDDACSKVDDPERFALDQLDACFYHVPFVKMARKAHQRHWEAQLGEAGEDLLPEISRSYDERVAPWLKLNAVVGNILTEIDRG